MKKQLVTLAILASLTFFSCNKTSKGAETTPETTVKETAKDTTNLLVGSWVQPNPINDKEVQGFTIKSDGTAESINMATLLYKKWWEEDGKLILVSESIGNSSSSMDTMRYDIVKNTATELEIKMGDFVDKYKKQ
ncbi:MAG TPA: lipocalin family protein [Flavobacterium sp.]|nr:lipocalin family protein [Flavobacterium sp.]